MNGTLLSLLLISKRFISNTYDTFSWATTSFVDESRQIYTLLLCFISPQQHLFNIFAQTYLFSSACKHKVIVVAVVVAVVVGVVGGVVVVVVVDGGGGGVELWKSSELSCNVCVQVNPRCHENAVTQRGLRCHSRFHKPVKAKCGIRPRTEFNSPKDSNIF